MSPIAPATLLQSGLSLFHDAGSQAREAAAALTSGDPNVMIDGMVGLMSAVRSSEIARKVVETAQEVDQAALDILV